MNDRPVFSQMNHKLNEVLSKAFPDLLKRLPTEQGKRSTWHFRPPNSNQWFPCLSNSPCEDLNTLRILEGTLTMDQQYSYGEELAQVVRRAENLLADEDPEKRFPLNGWGLYSLANSEATIRARALVNILVPY